MLQIRNLNISHKKDLHELVKDFNLVLNPGDKAVLIGEEGDGKSTLLKWIYRPELIESYAEAAGAKSSPGERLGYLPQELPREDGERSVYEFFCCEEGFLEKPPRELARLAGELGVPAELFYSEQRMNTLSGGEKVKLSLARLMLAAPTILLLDEPSNDLDMETLLWLEKFILHAEGAVLFISHDETLIERTANVVVHLEQLRRKTTSRATVARMPYRQFLKEREAGFACQEKLARAQQREEKARQEKLHRLEQQVKHEMDVLPKAGSDAAGRLLKKKMKAVKSMEHRYEREGAGRTELPEYEEAIYFKLGEGVRMPAGKTVLEYSLKELTVSDRVLSRDIFLRVRGGEKVCIVGKNGAGKTTLLRRIAEELLARRDIRTYYMPQNYSDLLPLSLSPADYLSLTGDKEEQTRIRTYLGALKFTADEMKHPIAQLSGGQKGKVLLLQMSLSQADVLILDEPTRNFSPLSGPVIRRMLREYRGAVISISHDRKYIGEVCKSVYRLTPEGLLPERGFEMVK